MSPTPRPARPAKCPETYRDQRSHHRYPITLEVKYRLNRNRVVQFGSARTLNISAGGVLFEVNAVLPSSGPIRLMLNWPFLLDEDCLLKLVIDGHIVRNEGNQVAVRIEHYEFHTAGARSQKAPLFSKQTQNAS